MGINNILTTKIHKVIMAGARAAIGNYCFRKSIYYILNKCDILDAKEMLLVSALNFMYKLNYNKGPESILKFFYPERLRDKTRKFRPLYNPNLKCLNILYSRGAPSFITLYLKKLDCLQPNFFFKLN